MKADLTDGSLPPACSPFFRQGLRSPQKNRKRSLYFLRAPSSAFGSARSFGCWIDSLARIVGADDEPPITNRESGALALALRHFDCCREFKIRWDSQRRITDRADAGCLSDTERTSCLQICEKRMSYAVRHLCPYRCYMRAFAPYRDWHALRSSLVENFPDCNVNDVLKGWSCILPHEAVTCLPRTTFLSPQGHRFNCAKQVIRFLSIRDGKFLDHMKICCESSGRSIPLAVSFRTNARAAAAPCDPAESPFGLLEELFLHDPWRLLLSTILLNRTTRRQVDPVMHEFLRRWPTCSAVLADVGRNNNATSQMAAVLKPLGMNLRRAAGILRFCEDYRKLVAETAADLSMDPEKAAFQLTKSQILRLYHCGEYASSAYRIFIQRSYDFEPGDHALTMYAEYQRGAAQSNQS